MMTEILQMEMDVLQPVRQKVLDPVVMEQKIPTKSVMMGIQHQVMGAHQHVRQKPDTVGMEISALMKNVRMGI